MENLTDTELREVHVRLWNWLAESASHRREDWPEWEFRGGSIHQLVNDCPACDVAAQRSGESKICNHCPLDWGVYKNHHRKTCGAINSPLVKWWRLVRKESKSEADFQEISKLALQISAMDWK